MIEDDLVTILGNAGIVAPVYLTSKATLPTGDGPYIGLRSTGGTGANYVQDSPSPAYRFPAFQIMVTAEDAEVAADTAEEVYAALAAVTNLTVGLTWFVSIRPLQEPLDMRLDDAGRARVGFNVIADYRR